MKTILRVILLIINLLFAVALVASTLAGKVEPSRCATVSILSYGYVVFLLANAAFIIMWLCLSRWEFLISVAAIVCRLSFIPLFFQAGGNTEPVKGDDVLRVMTFNAHGFHGLDSDTLMRADSGAALFVQLVEAEQPDVVCIQEFFVARRMKMKEKLAERGYKYHYGVHGESKPSLSILFSRWPIVKGEMMDKKTKFHVDLQKGDHRVRICCVHLDSYELNDSDYESFERLSHAKTDSSTHRLVKKFAETTRRHEQEWKEELLPLVQSSQVPIIIAGDFNDTPASYIYQQATHLLSDPYVEQGRGFGTTYHGPFPAFRIDFILHSRDMEALSYKRISTPISDHYPIVTDLRLPK